MGSCISRRLVKVFGLWMGLRGVDTPSRPKVHEVHKFRVHSKMEGWDRENPRGGLRSTNPRRVRYFLDGLSGEMCSIVVKSIWYTKIPMYGATTSPLALKQEASSRLPPLPGAKGRVRLLIMSDTAMSLQSKVGEDSFPVAFIGDRTSFAGCVPQNQDRGLILVVNTNEKTWKRREPGGARDVMGVVEGLIAAHPSARPKPVEPTS